MHITSKINMSFKNQSFFEYFFIILACNALLETLEIVFKHAYVALITFLFFVEIIAQQFFPNFALTEMHVIHFGQFVQPDTTKKYSAYHHRDLLQEMRIEFFTKFLENMNNMKNTKGCEKCVTARFKTQ